MFFMLQWSEGNIFFYTHWAIFFFLLFSNLAGGLANLGRGLSTTPKTANRNNRPTNHEELYTHTYDASPTAQQVYEDASSKIALEAPTGHKNILALNVIYTITAL